MSGQPLCIRTFAELIRERMNRSAYIRNFDCGSKTFETAEYVRTNHEAFDASEIYPFYKLLLDSVVYVAEYENEPDIPDRGSTMVTQLKKGNTEIHSKIKEIAQRKDAKRIVAAYFEVNLIPNIPEIVLSTVLDNIDTLVQGDIGLGSRKRKALKQARNQTSKRESDYLAEIWILAICNGMNKIGAQATITSTQTTEQKPTKGKDPFSAIKEAEDLLSTIPPPNNITPPEQIECFEQSYIEELYAAYGDKEGVPDFCESHLSRFTEYNNDIKERRIDYFSAESIRRGVKEIYDGRYANQFDVLKDETLAGVRNTALKPFQNGYERMLEVMQRATEIQVAQYLLSRSPYWISNRIKMGVCHFLVDDKKLRWVRR